MQEADSVGFLSLLTILNWVTIAIQNLYLHCTSFLKRSPAKSSAVTKRESFRLSRDEVELVMERLGLPCSAQDELGSDEISALFEEEEPSLQEVRDAFCVFDKKQDGFIDAEELQRVLLMLGFSEGVVGLGDCEEMIRAHDEDRDGVIDFNEFVRFMQSGFC